MADVAALLDNDVVLKVAALDVVGETLAVLGGTPPAVLGVARFVLRRRAARGPALRDRAAVLARLDALLAAITAVEPTESEIGMAADMEERALAAGLELDVGESQLAAMLVMRSLPLLLTGDKRAILALDAVAPPELRGRVACLEQLARSLLDAFGAAGLREKVCAEPTVDRALSVCMGCMSGEIANRDRIADALDSYRRHLAARATILADGPGLSPLTPEEDGVGRA